MSTPRGSSHQSQFAAALLVPDAATPDFVTARAGCSATERFDVYRNNVHASLIDALLAAFPVTARLVGKESFRALASGFLRRELPRHAALHDYGAGLPAFLCAWAPTASIAYLPDVAALEHAWWQAYGAADAPSLSPDALAAVDAATLLGLRARLHPAVRLIDSAHPVHGIWCAHQTEGEPAPPADWHGECVLVTRPATDVRVTRITPAARLFLAALATGATVETAALSALAHDLPLDLGNTLLLAIAAGAIQELH